MPWKPRRLHAEHIDPGDGAASLRLKHDVARLTGHATG